ncbi:endonuclease MutS2 [Paenibacillus sacheonensis]|uniref:DNA mismatch repair protein MutS n=1 Tax=Paenibacillus sacheonensis TaxID=742054 RepID=A0A7X4YMD6_9BACL|nr:DNA mismatch repair protein MutS [Paenibacillus sacheonensis]MBM7563350.1 dsDNA-specific endonuclease/ATPase MutS2 [Paenibacillus sacheonensis]NBC68094.1 DNA mismatch repair protein MutS [Paenibacillus sacheonensis]
MNQRTLTTLEFYKIKAMLVEYTVSDAGKALAERLEPSTRLGQVKAWLNETEEAAALLAAGASVPLSAMEGIEPFMALLGKGKIYTEQELGHLAAWLTAVAQMKRYMDGKRTAAPTVSAYADSMRDCPELAKELARCIRHGRITDQASPELADIRRHIAAAEDRIERRINQLLSKYKNALQEQLVSKRNGRFVIPVKRELRRQVPGTVWDESASGQTLFVEPADVSDLQGELQLWKSEEERERTQILSRLSDFAETHGEEFRWNVEAMATFDFIFARGKLARTYNGIAPAVVDRPYVRLTEARHPLLGEKAVPLTVEIGAHWRQLIITGPNTGGKTVALKTIGLFALMCQSGLLLPAGKGTELGMFETILADVGDGQSIEQSLSTFSAHMDCLSGMLRSANGRSLLLLDELAAGTDPGEGIALSIAVLEELLERGSLVAATTHFNEIKRFAAATAACTNARMAFDPETLKPTYTLEVGEAGDSYAFAIARRFGLPERVVQRAEQRVGQEGPKRSEIEAEAETGIGAAHSGESGKPSAMTERKKRQRPSKSGNSTSINDQSSGEESEQPEAAVVGNKKRPFEIGDCVWIYPLKRTGIVYRAADERGDIIVQVQKTKMSFNRKRLSLYIPSAELYPGGDYDLDIVFESKENRKKRKLMGRKYAPGVTIVTPAEEKDS